MALPFKVILSVNFSWPKQHLGQDLQEDQTEFDVDLKMTLTLNVKLLNLFKIVITLLVIDRFDL